MRIISIGDLVTDFYYKDGNLVGVNGGMTSHNIIVNIWIVNTFLDNFYKDNPKRYATGVW